MNAYSPECFRKSAHGIVSLDRRHMLGHNASRAFCNEIEVINPISRRLEGLMWLQLGIGPTSRGYMPRRMYRQLRGKAFQNSKFNLGYLHNLFHDKTSRLH